MTKNFCDLCGVLAVQTMPTLKVEFPDLKWTGPKMSHGSIACVDGTWTPRIEARMVFDVHDGLRSLRSGHPDLCLRCAARILLQMAESLTESDK